jgi:hypothetical protein
MDTRFYSASLDEQLFTVPDATPAEETAPATPVVETAPAPEAAPAPEPAAAAPVAPAEPPAPLKVLLLVTDPSGRLLDKCSFAIFKPGITPVKGEIRREDILMLGRTNENGIFDSDAKGVVIPPGTYPIKVVREGYKTFLSSLEVRQGEKAGYAILAFRLAPE